MKGSELAEEPSYLVLDPDVTSTRVETSSGGLLAPGSSSATIFNQLSAIIGPGALALPFTLSCFGAVAGSLMVITAAATAYYTATLLLKCTSPARHGRSPLLGSTDSPKPSFGDLVEEVSGSRVRMLGEVGIIGSCFGSLIGILHVIYTVMPEVIWGSEGIWQAKVFVSGIALVIVLPLSLVEKMNELRFIGVLCFASNLFTYIVIGLRFFFGSYIQGWDDELANINSMSASEIWLNTDHPADMLKALPICVQIFNVHWVLLPLFAELRAPSRHRISVVTAKSLSITASLYLFSGLLGYLSWLSTTKSDVLLNFSHRDGLMIAARGIVTLAAVCSCPAIVMVLRKMTLEVVERASMALPAHDTRLSQISEDETPKQKSLSFKDTLLFRVLLTVVIIVVATVSAIVVPGLDVVFGLTGSLTATLIIYVIPGLMFLSLDQTNEALEISSFQRIVAMLIVAWGLTVGLVCSVYIVYSAAT